MIKLMNFDFGRNDQFSRGINIGVFKFYTNGKIEDSA